LKGNLTALKGYAKATLYSSNLFGVEIAGLIAACITAPEK
jgi:hypothetical protein